MRHRLGFSPNNKTSLEDLKKSIDGFAVRVYVIVPLQVVPVTPKALIIK
jgi:hypothetical protein